jgi:hypothetical protein
VDGAYYEDLAGRLYGLLITLEDRLGGEQTQLLHHFIQVGEYGLALEEIAAALAQDQIGLILSSGSSSTYSNHGNCNAQGSGNTVICSGTYMLRHREP